MIGNLAEANVTVIAPKELEIEALLRLMGVEKETYHLLETNKEISITNGEFDLTAEPLPITHVNTLNSFAYKIKYESKTIYYSGDANEIPEEILKALNEGQIDLFYQDTCKAEYEGNPHLSLNKLAKLVNTDMRERVHCMHLNVGFDIEKAKQLGFKIASENKNNTIIFDDYKHIGIQKGVCGSRPTIIGRRIEPRHIKMYGSIEEIIEDYDLTREQVEECLKYSKEFE